MIQQQSKKPKTHHLKRGDLIVYRRRCQDEYSIICRIHDGKVTFSPICGGDLKDKSSKAYKHIYLWAKLGGRYVYEFAHSNTPPARKPPKCIKRLTHTEDLYNSKLKSVVPFPEEFVKIWGTATHEEIEAEVRDLMLFYLRLSSFSPVPENSPKIDKLRAAYAKTPIGKTPKRD